jgi:hypothetical protein
MITGQPDHLFNDPDNDGHDCVDCPEWSVFRCDDLAHPSDKPTEFTRP